MPVTPEGAARALLDGGAPERAELATSTDARDMGAQPDEAIETKSIAPRSPQASRGRSYFLVLEGASSSMFHLPQSGVVLVGRDAEADLRLVDHAASRRHAKVVIAEGDVQFADLDSHNGTRVNGERLEGARPLVSGDVVSIGDATLVLRSARKPSAGRLVEAAAILRRLGEEIERALAVGRPLALFAVALGTGFDRAAVAAVIGREISIPDVAGWGGAAELLVVAPERDEEEAEGAVQRLVAAIGPLAPGAKAGVGACPADGCDADTLLGAARAAAAVAGPGAVLAASRLPATLELGGRPIVVADPAMVRLFQLIRRLAASELPVLVCGETGAGKENAAFAVHHGSPRAKGPFVVLNCAALQETLVESELFGHERGAFSGAAGLKLGLLETASGGTVFLDEIGELSLAAQAKLLRAVETKRITRVGGVRPTDVDIRIVAATHRDLEAEVAAGRFRKDLFFRLSAATIMLPPLRERPREITLLARTFLTEACARAGRPPMELSAATMLALARYAWPGNVRELKNTMDYAAAALEDEIVEPWHLPARISGDAVTPSEDSETARPAQAEDPADASVAVAGSGEPRGEARPFGRAFRPLAEEIKGLERRRMTEALEATSGFQKRAAELIGMPLRTFVLKLKQHGIARRERGGPQ